MFDLGVEPWADDPPFHNAGVRCHPQSADPLAKQGGTTYTFVTGGIENVLAKAKAAAGDQDVAVIGGATIIQQFIKAGLLDELRIHLVSVLLGGGTPLFDSMLPEHVELDLTSVIDTPQATHLTFKVLD